MLNYMAFSLSIVVFWVVVYNKTQNMKCAKLAYFLLYGHVVRQLIIHVILTIIVRE